MQECVTLAAGQFDEAVALVLVEPFDDARDASGRSTGAGPASAKPGPASA